VGCCTSSDTLNC